MFIPTKKEQNFVRLSLFHDPPPSIYCIAYTRPLMEKNKIRNEGNEFLEKIYDRLEKLIGSRVCMLYERPTAIKFAITIFKVEGSHAKIRLLRISIAENVYQSDKPYFRDKMSIASFDRRSSLKFA